MNILMLLVTVFLLISGTLIPSTSAQQDGKDYTKLTSSKIQYADENVDQLGNNGIYGSSDGITPYGITPYGGPPNNYGGFMGGREIVRNRYGNRESNSNGRGDNDRGTTTSSSYPYPEIGGQDEIANGVFSNPYLGQRRRSFYGALPDGGYERPYIRGSYIPTRGIYSSYPGYRPGLDEGYIYPPDGINGSGVRLGQPQQGRGYGYDVGNGYGLYPGAFRNIPASYVPTDRGNGIYGVDPRGYGPALFGYERYPERTYPGLGLEYGRLSDRTSHGDKPDEMADRKGVGLHYPQPAPSARSPKDASKEKAKSLRKGDP